MNLSRVGALISKDFLEFRRTPSVFLPLIAVAVPIVLPFIIAILLPALFGEALSEDKEFERAIALTTQYVPALGGLPPEAAVQAFLFQQFLVFFILIPVAGAMALAAHSVVGEKQNRTLEPLLATPITTLELLVAKVVASALPSFAVALGALAVYLAGIWVLADPGVLGALISFRSFLIVFVLGPLAALVALQLAVMVSSRVNDARSAQQIGVLLILPVVALFISQITGAFFLTSFIIVLVALGLFLVFAVLTFFGVVLFERETILTRWK
jgi:ABC-2 type transport system permease protein